MLVFDACKLIAKTLRTLGTRRERALWGLVLLLGASPALAQQTTQYPKLLEHGGKRLAAYVNEITGTPTWIIDVDSLDFTLGSPQYLSSEAVVRTAADAFVDSAKDLFGIDPKQLEGPVISTNGTLWFISYQQVHDNLRVLGAQHGLTVARDGRLLTAGSRAYPKVQVNTTPALSSTEAMRVATGYALIPDPDVSAKDELVILPVEEEERYAFRLGWEITISNYHLKPAVSKTFLIDAHTGAILAEYTNIANHKEHHSVPLTGENLFVAAPPRTDGITQLPCVLPSGSIKSLAPLHSKITRRNESTNTMHELSGKVTLNYYLSPGENSDQLSRESGPFPGAKFTVVNNPEDFEHKGYTDAISGDYSVTLPNSGSYTITFELANQKASTSTSTSTSVSSIVNPCQTNKSFTVNVDGAVRLDFDWGWGDSGDGGPTSHALNGVSVCANVFETLFAKKLVSIFALRSASYRRRFKRHLDERWPLREALRRSADLVAH